MMVVALLAALHATPAQRPNLAFDDGLAGWLGSGDRGFRMAAEQGRGGQWLTAGWAARSAAPPGARYSVATRLAAGRYRGRRIRISAATRVPEFAQGAVSLFAVAGISEALTPLGASQTWRRHSFILFVPSRADEIELGFILEGTPGQFDADDVRVEIVR